MPAAPIIGPANSGRLGGAITATANWTPGVVPDWSTTGIDGYEVRATLVVPESYNGTVRWVIVRSTTSAKLPVNTRTLTMTLPSTGTYFFEVRATTALKDFFSPYSASSNLVKGQ